jgi:TolB-like protein/DNA-binding winged helix-turn-helix (wHTH) protein
MTSTSQAALRIGAWRVDPASWQISRDDRSVRLEARTMGLLLCLARRAGTVVSIDELLDEVWSGVIVTPDSVYQAVAALRRLLGDDVKQPAYIETVPRLGYRLVAAVSPWIDPLRAPEAAADSADTHPEVTHSGAVARPAGSARPRVAALWGTVAALCLALSAGLAFRGELIHGFNGLAGRVPQKSVAVLPFLDLTSRQMDEEYFADGMTEELIDKLSKIRGVRVPAPTSSFYFKGKQLSVADMARSLGVAYVLDGSVRKSDATLRIAVRLIRADDGYVVWSETYDRPEADKLAMQDDIASQVAKALKASLT